MRFCRILAMCFYKKIPLILFIIINSFLISYADVLETSKKGKAPKIPNKYLELSNSKNWDFSLDPPWIVQDNNNDGKPDSAIIISSEYNKVQENLDLNYDGYADDFAYFNSEGEIIFQEIDSNYDLKVDIWVEIENGSYILSIQQDEDFDGYVDKVQDFTEEE